MKKTTEYKKEMSVAGAIAVIAALGVGLFAVAAFPNGQSTTSTGGPIGGVPAVLLGYVSTSGVTCNLATGSCTMTLVNNSTVPLTVEGCRISPVISSNSTSTTWGTFNGTAGGPAAAGIPAGSSYAHGSEVPGSCTIPLSDLSHAPKGSVVSGGFMVKLASIWYSYPSGTQANINFEGTWS